MLTQPVASSPPAPDTPHAVPTLARARPGWLRWPAWASWALWLFAAAAAIAGVTLATEHLATRHLEADAARASASWAAHIGRSVQDIDLVFTGEVPSPGAQDHLTAVRGTVNLMRFRLYDAQGRLVLLSESLGTPVAGAGEREPHPMALTAAAALPGVPPTVKVHRGSGQADQPAVYSEAFVAVRHGSELLGVLAIELDLADAAELTTASFRRAASVAAGLMTLLLAVGAALYLQRVRHQQRSDERAHYLAQHDVLTGVLNRDSFRAALAAACHASSTAAEGSRRVAVLAVDLHRFSHINDNHGLATGDRLLSDVAQQLRGLVRRDDLLARMAGDQFAVLLRDVDAGADLGAQAERVLAAIAQPRELPQGRKIQLSACVGAAILGVDGVSAEALLRAADLALQRAKAHGPGRWSYYDASLDQALQERRQLTQELTAALAADELRLHFQPVFDGAGTLQGYEALARWPHAQRGFVPPAQFVAIAEESGLIAELGRWVLRAACREAAGWPAPLHVAVNLSPAQVREGPELLNVVREALASAGLPASRLEVEITESLLMGHDDQVLATLDGLTAMGVSIAMDDFGTGFSSLAYLWRYPFGKVKIDRAFTQRLGSDAKVDLIVRSIVRLAHSLGMRVNAEGVETEQQRAALIGHGCDELQGYLLGKPQPAERLAHRVAQTPAPASAPAPTLAPPLAPTSAPARALPPPAPATAESPQQTLLV